MKKDDNLTRMPAEWEPHEATWLSWPHYRKDWPGKFAPIPWVFAEMTKHIARSEPARILVRSAAREKQVRGLLRQAGADDGAVAFFRIPTDRAWIRDYGPIFVRHMLFGGALAALKFQFNAWARHDNWTRDNRVTAALSKATGMKLLLMVYDQRPVVLEGGSIDVNGHGALLATEECLLDKKTQARNPWMSRRDLENVLHEAFGARQVIWLGKGICGDDTHGHVDDLCRFVGRNTVVLCQEKNPKDINFRALAENRERLENVKIEGVGRLRVVPLPMPAPLLWNGVRLPASYANFYIANSAVLVPTFNDPMDREALGILADLFPGRRVVGIHAVDLVIGRGAIHCLTQQQPECGK